MKNMWCLQIDARSEHEHPDTKSKPPTHCVPQDLSPELPSHPARYLLKSLFRPHLFFLLVYDSSSETASLSPFIIQRCYLPLYNFDEKLSMENLSSRQNSYYFYRNLIFCTQTDIFRAKFSPKKQKDCRKTPGRCLTAVFLA